MTIITEESTMCAFIWHIVVNLITFLYSYVITNVQPLIKQACEAPASEEYKRSARC